MARFRPITFIVARLANANWAEVDNAVDVANTAQEVFRFRIDPREVHIKEANYRLASGALDLDRALANITRRQATKALRAKQWIFLTSEPYSDRELTKEFKGRSPEELFKYCYYLDTDPLGDRSTALVSTFIWDRLPGRADLNVLVTPSGRRALQPFLLYAFGAIAASRIVTITHHQETRGCPFDYCDDVREIDAFFEKRRFCDEDEEYLRAKIADCTVTSGQIEAVTALFNRAVGKPPKYRYHVALSYASPQRAIAEALAHLFRLAGLEVFFDMWYPHELAGKNLVEAFDEVYRKQSAYCVILISREYRDRAWTRQELRSALARAVEERGKEYILPVRVDTAELPGLAAIGEVRLDRHSVAEAADIVLKKIRR